MTAAVTTAPGSAPPTDDALRERFRPLFARIAAGAVEREQDRRLALEEAGWLRDAGFTRLRVPRELGGDGVTLRQLFLLVVDLAAAESNLPHALRIHFRFGEERRRERDTERGRDWLRRIAGGAVLGTAVSERGGSFGQPATTLRQDGDRLLLNGTKYYSTGALYADHVTVSAVRDDGTRVSVVVPADAPGVQLLDDWAGFGQRASASGTSVFTDVEVTDPGQVLPPPGGVGRTAFLQLFHLATVAGIVRRAVDDAAAFVRQRQRVHPQSGAAAQNADPLVQRVIGRAEAVAYALRSIVLDAAATLDAAEDARFALRTAPPEQRTPEREAEVAALELEAELDAYRAQITVLDLALATTNEIFEVGGSSALDHRFQLDRHWRNARTLASHNPATYRERQLGDYVLNGTAPEFRTVEDNSSPATGVSR
jgi:alkylation response protein AidB-like acyl-CoA dehydrogenase